MLKTLKILMIVCLSGTLISGCANKQQGGAAIGGITGALLGSQFGGKGGGKFLGMGIGMLAGTLIGSKVGSYLDEKDKAMLQSSSQKALEYSASGQEVEWKNPDSGHSGSIIPTKTYRVDGRYCREFTQTVVIGDKQEKAYGTACRQPDGQWQIISN